MRPFLAPMNGPKTSVVTFGTIGTNSREGGGRSVVLVPRVDRRAVLGMDLAQ